METGWGGVGEGLGKDWERVGEGVGGEVGEGLGKGWGGLGFLYFKKPRLKNPVNVPRTYAITKRRTEQMP